MRVLEEIPHDSYKITIFQWNGKYIIKVEQGMLEQSYKVDETEFFNTDDVKKLLNDTFLDAVQKRFRDMHMDLVASMQTL